MKRIEHTIKNSLDQQKICIVIYIDLKSAFDSVWTNGLIYKLINMGIRGKLLKILSSFLQNRTMQVLIQGVESQVHTVEAGTPQGAVLSPILFNIMTHDIPQR